MLSLSLLAWLWSAGVKKRGSSQYRPQNPAHWSTPIKDRTGTRIQDLESATSTTNNLEASSRLLPESPVPNTFALALSENSKMYVNLLGTRR